MGNLFFWIVRVFSTLVAGCALLATLWLVILGLGQVSTKEKLAELPAQPTFSGYVDVVARTSALPADSENGSNKSQMDASSKRFFAHMDKIEANLNAYGKAMDLGTINRPSLISVILQLLNDDDSETIEDYLTQLEKFTGDMAAQAPAMKKAATNDFRKATPDSILRWFDQAYRKESKDYQANLETAAADYNATLARGKWNLVVAAICFGIFIAFTMLLVLLQIERNTRRNGIIPVTGT